MIEKKILLSLVGVLDGPLTSHELIRLLSRRFEIYNFKEIIDESINDIYIERIDVPSQQMGSYNITEKGERELKNIVILDFEQELLTLYPEQKDFIKLLTTRLKRFQE